MNSLIATLLIIGIISSLSVIVLSEQIKTAVLDVLIKTIAERTDALKPPDKPPAGERGTASTSNWVPPGFKGPTEAPKIIGPSADPPNY